MAVDTAERTSPSAPSAPLGARRARLSVVLVLLLLVTAAVVFVATRSTPEPGPLAATIVPPSVGDAIPGQRIVLLVTVDGDEPGGEPAIVSATTIDSLADAVSITVAPERIRASEVAEVTVVIDETVVAGLPTNDEPMLGQGEPDGASERAADPADDGPVSPIGPEGVSVPITVTLTRGDATSHTEVPINISRGEDLLFEEASSYRDRFIPWLETERPELRITSGTAWTGTPVRPHILVVSHYLFLSEAWEMSVQWHIMIAPYDWARITLRPRDELRPTLAFEIPSVSDPVVVEIEPPAHVVR
jgi:hypothetical protein